MDVKTWTVQTVEVTKRPGQGLGLYLREGNGTDRPDGVFISRFAPGSVADHDRLLRVGDEIVSVNSVPVNGRRLEDVVIAMSIHRKLVLTLRTAVTSSSMADACPSTGTTSSSSISTLATEVPSQTPIVVVKGGSRVFRGRSRSPERQLRSPEAAANTTWGGRRPVERRGGWGESGRPYPRSLSVDFRRLDELTVPGDPGQALHLLADDSGDSGLSSDNSGRYRVAAGFTGDYHLQQQNGGKSPFVCVSPVESLGRRSHDDVVAAYANSTSGCDVTPKKSERYLRDADQQQFFYPRILYETLKRPTPNNANALRTTGYDAQHNVLDPARSSPKVTHCSSSNRDDLTCCSPSSCGSDPRDPTFAAYVSGDVIAVTPEGHHQRTGSAGFYSASAFANGLDQRPSRGTIQRLNRKLLLLQDRCFRLSPSSSSSKILSPDDVTSCSPSSSTSSFRSNHRIYDAKQAEFPVGKMAARPWNQPLQNGSYELGQGDQRTARTYVSNAGSTGHGRSLSATRPARADDMGTGTGGGRRLLQIRKEAFKVYSAPDPDPEAGESGVDGTMLVRIFCASGLFAPSNSRHEAMYCVIEIDSVGFARTDVTSGSTSGSFDWNDRFLVDLTSARTLTFAAYRWTAHARSRVCFTAPLIGLRGLAAVDRHHQFSLKLDPNGELYVELSYRDPRESYRRTPTVHARSVFGNDLDAVVHLDRSGIAIPVLVRRCVEEVERVGMEQIGLYRVCASVDRIKSLREMVERDPDSVGILGNGMDVNVVTGVLKEFLRELPEPLCTEALYQMFMDALMVQLPQDPEGNARLMLSIVDCLPKSHLETLTYLLDHLVRVSLKSALNGMTSADLSLILGPVFFCPSFFERPSKSRTSDAFSFRHHSELLRYLLDIWPLRKQYTAECSSNVKYLRSSSILAAST